MTNEYLVAFDLGSSRVSAAIAKVDKFKGIHILATTSVKYNGMKKSVVVDLESTVEAVKQCKSKLEAMADYPISDAYIGISAGLCRFYDSKGSISLSSEKEYISEEDVQRVINLSKVINKLNNEEVVDAMPIQYIIDNYDGIKDPVGMTGSRLEVDSRVFVCEIDVLYKLLKGVENAGLELRRIILQPVALSSLVAEKVDKNFKAGFINIGADTIDLSIYKDGNICYTKLIPIGGSSITNDIAKCINISFAEAEKLKLQQADYVLDRIDKTITIEGNKKINCSLLREIIYARAEELVSISLEQLKQSNFYSDINDIYLAGGGILHYNEIIDKYKSMCEKNIRIVQSDMMTVGDPEYHVPIGIIKFIVNNAKTYDVFMDEDENIDEEEQYKEKGIISKIRRFIEDIF